MVMIESDSGGSFLAARWLGLRAFTAKSQVQSLIRELRSLQDPLKTKNKTPRNKRERRGRTEGKVETRRRGKWFKWL